MDKRYDCIFLGDINPDLVMLSDGQLPQLGREIECKHFYAALGGSTGICAGVFGALGLPSAFYGRVGDDFFGHFSVETMAAAGVDISHILYDKKVPTPVTISFSTPTDRALVSYGGGMRLKGEDFSESILDETRHIHIGSFFIQHRQQPHFLKLFSYAREKGVTTSLDAGWDSTENWDYGLWELLHYTDIFFPNESEATAITGKSDPLDAARKLSEACRIAVVKCGKEGSVLSTGDTLLRCPTYSRYKMKDSTGAGDSFNAGFLHAYLKGYPLLSCMRYGSATASLRVSVDRAAHPWATLTEVEKIVNEESE